MSAGLISSASMAIQICPTSSNKDTNSNTRAVLRTFFLHGRMPYEFSVSPQEGSDSGATIPIMASR